MEILLFRAALAPSLVLIVSLAARRLGPRAGGQLLGSPTTTGPFLALVCLSSGPAAAARATHGSATGQLVVVAFSLAYGRLAPARRPGPTLLAALACAGAVGAAGALSPTIWLTAGLALAAILAGLLTWPPPQPAARTEHRRRAWEIPLRMVLAGATLLTAMAASAVLGSFVGGVLSSLPVLMTVMAPSLHRSAGPEAAAAMARGAMTAATGTVAFLLVLSATLVPLGPWAAFPIALAAMAVATPLLRLAAARLAATGLTAARPGASAPPEGSRREARRGPASGTRREAERARPAAEGSRRAEGTLPPPALGSGDGADGVSPGPVTRARSRTSFPGRSPRPPTSRRRA